MLREGVVMATTANGKVASGFRTPGEGMSAVIGGATGDKALTGGERESLLAAIDAAHIEERRIERLHAEAVERYLAACRALTVFDIKSASP